MNRLVPLFTSLLILGSTAHAACTVPKGMAHGRVASSPLLKYDCAETQDLMARYKKSSFKPKWVEVYSGKFDKPTITYAAQIIRAFAKEGFSAKVNNLSGDSTDRGYTFTKGNLALGGQIVVYQLLTRRESGELLLMMVGR
ncbi:hypothetical protein [Deinococcus hohokamensis]|uniref:Uncharacterized protein n=1 Tax=Deinococcus hohokamensis TaxID=309883 RepID=A0ABV9I751_9DEIO